MKSMIKLSGKLSVALYLFVAVIALIASALPSQAMNRGTKTCLIINSYHEDELWAANIVKPIELYLAKDDSIKSEQVFLNNSAVTDMETYDAICDNIFKKYSAKHPEYVVLLGNFAFTLRDRIVSEWGDVPFVLISRIETYAPIEQYFSQQDSVTDYSTAERMPLGQLRGKYNFTAVIVPDFLDTSIELMMDMIPDMEEFRFISDRSYVNKIAAMNLQSSLSELYPDIKFTWLQGSEENSNEMIETMIKPHPKMGILLSSWVYEIENTRGLNVLTTKDLTFLSGSVNPVFAVRQFYMSMGAVGGAFIDANVMNENIIQRVDAMVKGENLHQVPFFVPDKPQIKLNYTLAKNYGLDLEKLPKDTIFVDKPETYLEKYWGWLVVIFIALLSVIGIFIWRNKVQRRQIDTLQRHHDFINQMPLPYTKATLWLDKDNNVININYDLKNKTYEELIAKNSMPDNPLHLFTNAYLSDIAKKLDETSQPLSLHYHFKRTGLYCYFIFVPLGKIVELQKVGKNSTIMRRLDIDVFAIDMTKDHQMQQQLRDQAVTIDISMEMAKLVPWQWDAGTDYLSFYINSDTMFIGSNTVTRDGKSTSVIKIEDFLKLMPPADAERMARSYTATLRGDLKRLDAEYRLRSGKAENPEEDTYEWCESHGVVTDTDSDGRPLRMTGSIQFITERKKQEEEMAQALTKAKESDMLKSAFLANMSHEIRTPLNAIVGFSNLLTTTDNMDDRREFAEIINRNNELLLSLINDILDLAKIESNTITLTYDLSDIHDVVSSIAKTVSIRVPKGVKLNVAHYADSCIVRTDAGHVSQVLINLLTNATKFTKRGSITVGYEVFEDEKKLYFYVKDTGIGIKKENLDKVFNRFVKLNNFVQGSGLGLAICRTLVEKMGGEIGVESAGEGRGCMFWFTIPYDPIDLKVQSSDAVVVRDAQQSEHIVGERPDHPAKVQLSSFEFNNLGDISNEVMAGVPSGLNVLIAEDNPSNYWLMARLMQDKFNLFHAENGQIALDMLDEVNPDIIIMDINMPELDGYGAVEQMRKRGVKVPIIAVTAYAFASDRIRILSSGFDAFVSKPVSASILYDTISEVWERKNINKDDTADSDDTAATNGNAPVTQE